MFKTAAEVRQTFQAFTAVAVVSNSLLWLIGGLWYWAVEDIDSMPIQSGAIPIVAVLTYSFVTIQLVFIPAVYLRKRFNSVIATILPPALITLIVTVLLYRNDIDSPISLVMISILVFLPWYLADLR